MIPTRVIPCLLLRGSGLVKTTRFKSPVYLGDPCNTVRIFNDKEVDELVIYDITATPEHRAPRFEVVREIVNEAFMPVGYGGGLRTVEECRQMLALGVEKVIINSHAAERPAFISELADRFGSQSVVVAIDVKKGLLGGYEVMTEGGARKTRQSPVAYAQRMAEAGAGELIVNAIDRDGTMAGYDVPLVRSVADAVTVPVIASGGAGSVDDMAEVVRDGHASAVAAGSFFVFHGRHRAVLISYPSPDELRTKLPVHG